MALLKTYCSLAASLSYTGVFFWPFRNNNSSGQSCSEGEVSGYYPTPLLTALAKSKIIPRFSKIRAAAPGLGGGLGVTCELEGAGAALLRGLRLALVSSLPPDPCLLFRGWLYIIALPLEIIYSGLNYADRRRLRLAVKGFIWGAFALRNKRETFLSHSGAFGTARAHKPSSEKPCVRPR